MVAHLRATTVAVVVAAFRMVGVRAETLTTALRAGGAVVLPSFIDGAFS